MAQTKLFPVRMSPAIHRKLKREALKRDMTMNAIVLETLDDKYTTSRVERKLDKILQLLKTD